MIERVTAFAPASIGNLGVGFDMLGLALEGIGDRVTAARVDTAGVSIDGILGPDGRQHPQLSSQADRNTASIAAQALWDAHGGDGGLSLAVHKGVPLKSGMGSSAASAVAAVVAVNALLAEPLDTAALLPFALEGEKFASNGLHADNVAPSLLGGLVLCPQVLLPRTISLPVPRGVSAVLLHPELEVSTAEARQRLAPSYALDLWLAQQGYLAAFVAACASSDLDLIRASLRDVIIEPQRADVVPCFADVQAAALAAGALGCSLSGSGPSIFSLAEDAGAGAIAAAMEQACRRHGLECQTWISSMQAPGAHVEPD